MKKITLFIALLVCAIGFSQRTTDVSSLGENNPVKVQAKTIAVITEAAAANYLSEEVSSYVEYGNSSSVSSLQINSERSALVTGNQNRAGGTVTFTDLANFQAACAGSLVSEDFSGGPGGITGCGPIVSSAGDGCFSAGELEEGFDIQASNGTDVIFIGAGEIGNTSVLMGANTFLESTIINFTGPDDVFSVGHDIWNNSDPDTTYDVYDTGGALMDSFNLNNTVGTENFFGIMTDYAIGHIEIIGLNDSGELFGNLLFGDCNPSGGTDCSQSNPSNAFENGRGFNAGNGWTVATDVIVPMGSDMMLNQLVVNAFNNVGATILSADITIYDDAAGLPGSVVTSETLVPTSETYIGTNFGFDMDELVFDLTPVSLAGDNGADVSYWVAIQVTCSDGGPAYWENTTATAVGEPQAFDDGTGFTIPDATLDSVYEFVADCTPHLGTSDNTIEGFSFYPNPTTNVLNLSSQENIERVSIYNILGQTVVDLNVNATSTQLNVDYLTTGTYIMKVSVEGQTGTYKIIKN